MEERVFSAYVSQVTDNSTETKAGCQERNLEAGAEAELWRNASYCLVHPTFLLNPGPPAHGLCCPLWAEPSTLIISHENPCKGLSKEQSLWVIFLNEGPSSKMTLVYVTTVSTGRKIKSEWSLIAHCTSDLYLIAGFLVSFSRCYLQIKSLDLSLPSALPHIAMHFALYRKKKCPHCFLETLGIVHTTPMKTA